MLSEHRQGVINKTPVVSGTSYSSISCEQQHVVQMLKIALLLLQSCSGS